MRCVSADGAPAMIGLISRSTLPTSRPSLLGMSLLADPGYKYFTPSS